MTAPVHEPPAGRLVVHRARIAPAPEPYPLATRTGVELLVRILAAGQHWRPLTGLQRSALRRAYQAGLAAIPDDVPGGTLVPLPELPDDVHPATTRSLVRRGLAADGRLTLLAIEVITYAVDRRPIRTVTTTGGVL